MPRFGAHTLGTGEGYRIGFGQCVCVGVHWLEECSVVCSVVGERVGVWEL